MPENLRITVGSRDCDLDLDEANWLGRELHRVSRGGPDAAMTVAIGIEHQLESGDWRPIPLLDTEEDEILAILNMARAETAPLSTGLEDLRDAILVDRGII